MCVIYVCNSILPDDAELARGHSRNDDGAGISWLAPDPKSPKNLAVHWQKGLKDDEAVKKFILEEKIPFPLIIHFRTASVGGTIAGLTHPFPTVQGVPLWEAGAAPEVLFHNGHLHNWDDLVMNVGLPSTERFPDGPWSDTRALAWLTYLKGPGVLDFVIKSSRVVLMHADTNTLEGEEYDMAEDHITLYGSGWIHKTGFSQSISTSPTYISKVYTGPGMHRAGWEIDNDMDDYSSRTINSSDVKVITAHASASQESFNVWTIDELSKLIIELQGEQTSAKLAAGI